MKTRKLLCLGLAVLLASSNVPGRIVFAEELGNYDDYEDDNYEDDDYEDDDYEDYEYEELEDGTVEIIGYYGMDTELEIPAEINGMRVTGIGYHAFNGCDDLIRISIPEGVTTIGEKAFLNCYSLESVSLPESVVAIGNGAFYWCSALTSINIPGSVTNIGNSAFYNCETLEGIDIPDSVTSMGNEVFYGCHNLKNVNISSNVTSIGNSVFKYCSGLTEINIPDGVTTIGDNAFERCSGLASVNIPESVTTIGNNAFLDCSRNLILTVIKGSYAEIFAKENALKYLREGEEASAFTFTELQDGTVEISGYQGEDTQLVIPAEIYGKKVSGIQEHAFGSNESITSIELADGIVSIGKWAFFWCSNLKSITIPESVTHIGSGICDMCVNLEEIKVSEKNTSYASDKGALYNKDKTELLRYPEKNSGNIQISGSVTRIGDYAFSWCRNNTAVTIPKNVTQIGKSAFEYSNFSSIDLPENITDIGDYAFVYCSFRKMELPKNVKNIGDSALGNCEKLTSINIPASVEHIGDDAFSDSIETITVDSGNMAYTVEDNILYDKSKTKVIWCSKKKTGKITLPEGVEEIADSLFNGCENITGIVLPERLKKIGRFAFGNCSSLEEIRIPDSVTDIGEYAFSECASLKTVTLPRNLTSIGYGIFQSCNSLMEIMIPQGVTEISTDAFEDCDNLANIEVDNNNSIYASEDGILYNKGKTELILCPQGKAGNITLPESVESIGTFSGCSALKSIKISKNVSSIDEWSFPGCSSLIEFTVDDGNNAYASKDGVLYNKELTHLILCPPGKTGSVTIPASVTDIPVMYYGFGNAEEIVVDGGNAAYASKDGILYDKELTKLLMCPSGKKGSITIPASVTSIECGFADVKVMDSGFRNVTEINVDADNRVYASRDGMLYNKELTKLLMCPSGRTGKVTIPDDVEIGFSAFEGCYGGCDGITVVEIPAGMISDIESIIYKCRNLTDIAVDDGNPKYASRDGILYDKQMTTLVSCPRGKSGNIVIPDGVKYIGASAFSDCSKLCITFPESVVWIGGKTFADCSQLKLIVPSGSAAESFAKYAWGNWGYIGEEHTHIYVNAVTREPSCVAAGVRTYTCSECGDSYTEPIPMSGHSYQSKVTKATAAQNGNIAKTCTKCGEKTTEIIYAPKAIALSKSSFVYNKKNQQPIVTIKDSRGRTLSSRTDYNVTYPKAAKDVGQYTVTINFKGNYSGVVKKSFTIVPKGTSISKVTPKKKGFSVKWKKQKNQTTGYVIAYATDSKFSKKNTKVVPVKKNGTTSKSIGKLKAKKKYYVRIRTYKIEKGKKYYSGWSKVKKVTVKK